MQRKPLSHQWTMYTARGRVWPLCMTSFSSLRLAVARSTIFWSTVLAVTILYTTTGRVWPIRWQRSWACRSLWGFCVQTNNNNHPHHNDPEPADHSEDSVCKPTTTIIHITTILSLQITLRILCANQQQQSSTSQRSWACRSLWGFCVQTNNKVHIHVTNKLLPVSTIMTPTTWCLRKKQVKVKA